MSLTGLFPVLVTYPGSSADSVPGPVPVTEPEGSAVPDSLSDPVSVTGTGESVPVLDSTVPALVLVPVPG